MQNFDLMTFALKMAMFFIPFLFALCFHELAHGLVAKWKGDDTAERQGRLSMNPMVHADPIGTWVLPISALLFNSPFFFGWAKPVPVDTRNLRRPKQDMFWVALAGPASNILLALVATVGFGVVLAYVNTEVGSGLAVRQMIQTFIGINLFLALFNLIPIHPLDGGKVIEPFLPIRANMWLEQNQSMLSMFLLVGMLVFGGILAYPVSILANVLVQTSYMLANFLQS